MSIYKPYTYLIGWSKHNKWYYGCQYGKKAHPDNLWNTYYTSSKRVKDFGKVYGDPDIVEIRLVSSKETVIRCEERILTKIGAAQSDIWLNGNNGGKKFFNVGGYNLTETTKNKMRKPKPKGFADRLSKVRKGVPGKSGEEHPMFGRHHRESSKLIMSQKKKNIYEGKGNPFYGKTHSDNVKSMLRKKALNRERLTCPVCNKTMDSTNYKKYKHGPNCKG